MIHKPLLLATATLAFAQRPCLLLVAPNGATHGWATFTFALQPLLLATASKA
jgi:hypothetical protein